MLRVLITPEKNNLLLLIKKILSFTGYYGRHTLKIHPVNISQRSVALEEEMSAHVDIVSEASVDHTPELSVRDRHMVDIKEADVETTTSSTE